MDEFPTPTYLRNHQIVLDAYGYWPSFHDAPLLSFGPSSAQASAVELGVHMAEMTSEVDARGYFGSIKHHLISFVFFDVEDVLLSAVRYPEHYF
jgi:hypothetical protein